MTAPLIILITNQPRRNQQTDPFEQAFKKFREGPRGIRGEVAEYVCAIATGREARNNDALAAFIGTYATEVADTTAKVVSNPPNGISDLAMIHRAGQAQMTYEFWKQQQAAQIFLTDMTARSPKMARWAYKHSGNTEFPKKLETPDGSQTWMELMSINDTIDDFAAFGSVTEQGIKHDEQLPDLIRGGIYQSLATSVGRILYGANVFYENAVREFPELADEEIIGPKAIDIAGPIQV